MLLCNERKMRLNKMFSLCMETAQFSLKPASIVDATMVLRILKSKRNLQINKESHSDKNSLLY